MKRTLLLWCMLLSCTTAVFGQITQVNGQVTDATTGEPLPFVTVSFKGTGVGITTDFDGFYALTITVPADSLQVSYIGYKTVVRAVKVGEKQMINIQLAEATNELTEVVVKPGENPAIRIIRAAQKRRTFNDYEKLDAFQYESFTKVQLAVDQLSQKNKKRKVLKDILPLFDTVSQLTDGTTKPVLPVFISETISDFYFLKNPRKFKEYIKASKLTGVGHEEGSVTAQLLGSTFQQYDFHSNYLRILDKDFMSPVADAGRDFYIYTLRDSVEIDGYKCYQIEVLPRRPSDLAFTGTIWITDTTFAIKRLQLFVDRRANLNFIDQLKIQQEYEQTTAGAWVPGKTRVLLNLDEPSSVAPGVIALFYVSNRNIVVNQPKEVKFYEEQLTMAPDAWTQTDDYWEGNRHEQLTEGDKKVMKMIDTLNNLPVVKTWIEIVNIAVSGYKEIGKIDVGPYAFLYGFNNLEGHRFRLGFRTNYKFSEKWVLRGYGAYGTYDNRFKYGAQAELIASRKHWTVIGAKHKNDVEQIGVSDQNYNQSNLFTSIALFQANQLNRTRENTVWVSSEFKKDWTQRITFQNKFYEFEKIKSFNFAYVEGFGNQGYHYVSSNFATSSITLETRFAYQEQFLNNKNERISLGTRKAPIITLAYTKGFKGILGGEFNYDKLNITVSQNIRMGRFGEADYIFSAGKVFNTLPYPILDVQRGNNSFVSSRSTYNLMNLFEFVCDQYVAMNYEHHLGGLITNRLPAIKKLKWRFFVGAKSVWGSVSEANVKLLPQSDDSGTPVTQFYKLNREPYVEASYGIENIFSFIRVDFIHRMTHLSNPGAYPFGVKISAQFSF